MNQKRPSALVDLSEAIAAIVADARAYTATVYGRRRLPATGIAWTDETGDTRVWFDSGDGLRAWRPSMLPGHEDAFALTVHKAQGSEFDRVLLALPEHGARVLSRELLYTGLTRCRREIALWASEAALRAAVGRRAQRWSGLAERLSNRT